MTVPERARDAATEGLVLVDLLTEESRRVVRYAATSIARLVDYRPTDEQDRERQSKRADVLRDVIEQRVKAVRPKPRPEPEEAWS